MEKDILKQLIQIAGSQKELAIKAGVPEPRISEWLNEKRNVKLSKLIEISTKLGFEIKFSINKKTDGI